METKSVYVAFLNTDGSSKVYGVFKKFEDAMKICKSEAEECANDLFPKDYEYEKISYD